jgi:glycosyltransferase involved in cell wall biosynthesis
MRRRRRTGGDAVTQFKTILHVIGLRNGWGIDNRAKNLSAALQPIGFDCRVASTFETLPNAADFDCIHFHSLVFFKDVSVVRWLTHARRFLFEVVSERSLKYLPSVKSVAQTAVACIVKNPRLAELPELQSMNVPLVYIPNGVDSQTFRPANRTIRVGWAGRKDQASRLEYKGVPILDNAIEIFNRLSLGTKAVLCFDGGDYPKTILSPGQMADFYRGIDVLVCASEAEGCSNVVLEALACGTPVISTDCGIARELEADGLVTLVERNPDAICSALIQCSETRLPAVQRYFWPSVAEQYAKLYRTILEENGGRP